MAVRSRRLYGPVNIPAGANTTLFTVPSGRTLVVRSLRIVNTSSALVAAVRWGLTAVPTAAQLGTKDLPAASYWTDDTWMALNPGDVYSVRLNAGGPSGVAVSLFGALLLGEPA